MNERRRALVLLIAGLFLLAGLLDAGTAAAKKKRRCHRSYPTVCIKPPPPDLDCDDIRHRNFKVRGSDPHGFDGDNDGVGCET